MGLVWFMKMCRSLGTWTDLVCRGWSSCAWASLAILLHQELSWHICSSLLTLTCSKEGFFTLPSWFHSVELIREFSTTLFFHLKSKSIEQPFFLCWLWWRKPVRLSCCVWKNWNCCWKNCWNPACFFRTKPCIFSSYQQFFNQLFKIITSKQYK